MTWLIVGLLLLAAFGPIAWLIPSRKDRRLARMRKRARELGLTVQMSPIRKRNAAPSERVSSAGTPKSPTIIPAVYRLPFPHPIKHLPGWKVDRDPKDDAGPTAGWVWDVVPSGPEASALSGVWPLLATLPDDALAVEATRLDVGCWWLEQAADNESENAVNSLRESLQTIANALVALNDRVEARIRSERGEE
jgi:hypothetical protein